jgi:glutaryl-CoA dehydrogenase (non-decarboxylating)
VIIPRLPRYLRDLNDVRNGDAGRPRSAGLDFRVDSAYDGQEALRLVERAAGDAVQIHGANGYSDEYPVGRFYRNCKGAVIYEGTREIHKVMQADYVLGYRVDRPTRCELPAYGERTKSEV